MGGFGVVAGFEGGFGGGELGGVGVGFGSGDLARVWSGLLGDERET